MSAVAWHPDTPTRLVTASEDDSSPVIMLWDLRNSRAPEKIMTGHDKGVLSLSWCKQDADLLLSCGKDNRSICWNPQTCEIVGELPSSSNWSFEVQWSPRNPAMLATASFDGKIGVHSLQSTNAPDTDAAAAAAAPQLSDGSDFFNQATTADAPSKGLSLKQPPKWLRRPVSAVFGFGGQLVSTGGPSSKPFTPTVHLRHLVSEPSIVERATKLQSALDGQSLAEFCAERSQDPSTRPDDIANWKALQTLFRADSRDELVALLGFSKEDVANKVSQSIAAFKTNGTTAPEEPAAVSAKSIDEPSAAKEAAVETVAEPASEVLPRPLLRPRPPSLLRRPTPRTPTSPASLATTQPHRPTTARTSSTSSPAASHLRSDPLCPTTCCPSPRLPSTRPPPQPLGRPDPRPSQAKTSDPPPSRSTPPRNPKPTSSLRAPSSSETLRAPSPSASTPTASPTPSSSPSAAESSSSQRRRRPTLRSAPHSSPTSASSRASSRTTSPTLCRTPT